MSTYFKNIEIKNTCLGEVSICKDAILCMPYERREVTLSIELMDNGDLVFVTCLQDDNRVEA